jgi:hypothetical protein
VGGNLDLRYRGHVGILPDLRVVPARMTR